MIMQEYNYSFVFEKSQLILKVSNCNVKRGCIYSYISGKIALK